MFYIKKMNNNTNNNNPGEKQAEIYTYEAPWLIYACNWSVRDKNCAAKCAKASQTATIERRMRIFFLRSNFYPPSRFVSNSLSLSLSLLLLLLDDDDDVRRGYLRREALSDVFVVLE